MRAAKNRGVFAAWLAGRIVVMVLTANVCFGQQISIQQPVIQQFGVSTTVMVPVGGYAYIGGNRSALDSSSRYGFGRFGSSRGYQRSSSSMWSSARVYDLHSLDEAILNSYARQQREPGQFGVLDAAPRPFAGLGGPTGSGGLNNIRNEQQQPVGANEEPAAVSPVKTISREQFEDWARDAEARGKRALARSYWEAAAKKGSLVAQDRLAEMDQKVLSIGRPSFQTPSSNLPASNTPVLVDGIPPAPLPAREAP